MLLLSPKLEPGAHGSASSQSSSPGGSILTQSNSMAALTPFSPHPQAKILLTRPTATNEFSLQRDTAQCPKSSHALPSVLHRTAPQVFCMYLDLAPPAKHSHCGQHLQWVFPRPGVEHSGRNRAPSTHSLCLTPPRSLES